MFLLAGTLKLSGALLLIPTMIGAIATHLFVIGGSPAMPIMLLIASVGIVWARRNQLRGVRSRLH